MERLKNTKSLTLSIVIPCYNEEESLPTSIKWALEAIQILNKPGEVVVADNGSSDTSVSIAQSMGARVVHVQNKGYGAALIGGMSAAYGKYIVIGDADGSYDFRESVQLIHCLDEGYDLAIGSRLNGKIEPGAMPFKNRYFGTPALTFALNILFKCKYSDVNSGMRAIRKESFIKMQLESQGMEFASEMLIKAAIYKLNICEKPITLKKDLRSRPPHLRPWRDGWRHLKYILMFAPKVIFSIPGFLLTCIGLFITLALSLHSDGSMVKFGQLHFGDHWVVAGALSTIVGYQILTTGMLAHTYTLTHRTNIKSNRTKILSKFLSFEICIFIALFFILIGLSLELIVTSRWIANAFGQIQEMRKAILGMVLIILGTQTLFFGFFFDVIRTRYLNKLSLWENNN